MSDDELRSGDVVELRSGSPPMTVIGAVKSEDDDEDDDEFSHISVVWFADGEFKEASFFPNVFRLVIGGPDRA